MKYLAKIFVALCALGLSSCSGAKKYIVGTWVPTDYVCENRGDEISKAVIEVGKKEFLFERFEFDASGSYKCDFARGFILIEGTYAIKGDSLIMTPSKVSSRERLEDDFKEVDASVNEIHKDFAIISINDCRNRIEKYRIRKISDKTMVLAYDRKVGLLDYTNVYMWKKE